MISKEEIKHIAKLARLDLSEEEITKAQKELSAVLDYFNLLKEADISGIELVSHSLEKKNILREDKAEEREEEASKKMISQAPDRKEEFIKVRAIL